MSPESCRFLLDYNGNLINREAVVKAPPEGGASEASVARPMGGLCGASIQSSCLMPGRSLTARLSWSGAPVGASPTIIPKIDKSVAASAKPA
ncbi:MAG: hypothetical protein [Microviridae sp.]|nr:MAG: hypothetical protein [Microviridae sp.]